MYYVKPLDLVTSIMISVTVSAGTGQHLTDIRLSELPWTIHSNLIATVLLVMTIVIPKLSVAVLLVRLLDARKLAATVLIGLAVIGIALGITVTVITFAQCKPVAGNWNPVLYHPKCLSPDVLVDVSYVGGGECFTADTAVLTEATTQGMRQCTVWRFK